MGVTRSHLLRQKLIHGITMYLYGSRASRESGQPRAIVWEMTLSRPAPSHHRRAPHMLNAMDMRRIFLF